MRLDVAGRVHGWVADRAIFWDALADWVDGGQLQPSCATQVSTMIIIFTD